MDPDRDGPFNGAGLLAIVGGRLEYRAPSGGSYPMLHPADGLHIRVNGRPLERPRPIFPMDQVELVPVEEPPQAGVQVMVDPQAMMAYLVVHRRPGRRYRLLDAGPSPDLRPRVAVEPVDAAGPDLEEARQALARAGVVYGIDWETVEACVREATGRPVVVAVGDRPRPPAVSVALTPRPEVQPGEVVATVRTLRPAVGGRDVFGRSVPPPAARALSAGPGVRLEADGMTAIATRAGRPRLQGERVWVEAPPGA